MTKPFACDNVVKFSLTPHGGGTDVTWFDERTATLHVQAHGHGHGLLIRCCGSMFEKGLSTLKTVAESWPLQRGCVSASSKPQSRGASTESELVIMRVFDAPRDLVWKAWTNPKQAVQWWGPKDYPATNIEMDVRAGGIWSGRLRSTEDGRILTHRGVFREVTKPERLVFTFAWDEEGERGLETLVTITFTAQGNKTLMTFRQAPFQSAEERDGHKGGWTSAFDRFDEQLPSLQGVER